MKNLITFCVSVMLLIAISGCGTSGAFRTSHVTNVELSQPNFKFVAKDVAGESMQGYLVGLSIAQGAEVGIFALARVSGDEKLYDAALKNLWVNYREKYGASEGKKLALVNIRQDTELLNTLVYTQAKYFITADVIEFLE